MTNEGSVVGLQRPSTTTVANGHGTIWHHLDHTNPSVSTTVVVSQSSSNSNDDDDTSKVRICFRNHTPQNLILCWVGEDGTYHHYYTLSPYRTPHGNERTTTNSGGTWRNWLPSQLTRRRRRNPNNPSNHMVVETTNVVLDTQKSKNDENENSHLNDSSAHHHHNHKNDNNIIEDTIVTTDNDHIETSTVGHAFVIMATTATSAPANDRWMAKIQAQESWTPYMSQIRIIGAYRVDQPLRRRHRRDSDEEDNDDDDEVIHLVEVVMDPDGPVNRSANHTPNTVTPFSKWRQSIMRHRFSCCCSHPKQKNDENVDHSHDDSHDIEEVSPSVSTTSPSPHSPPLPKSSMTTAVPDANRYVLTARLVRVLLVNENEVYDTTHKYYQQKYLGQCRWPVMVEPKWYGNDRTLEEILAYDLDCMVACLPPHALTLLRDTSPTPIYINQTLRYGTKRRPQVGSGMCFHPGSEWLRRNGMSIKKCECVELYRASEYRDIRVDWGMGGILLHEFCHAYHHKGCIDGYDNDEIIQCYENAMKDGIYDSVPVHGPQGPTAAAYAKTNAMEYFAELSTAFLGGVSSPMHVNDKVNDPYHHRSHVRTGKRKTAATKDILRTNHSDSDEYNKWYPHNRQQIRDHDPRAYELLKKMWKIQ